MKLLLQEAENPVSRSLFFQLDKHRKGCYTSTMNKTQKVKRAYFGLPGCTVGERQLVKKILKLAGGKSANGTWRSANVSKWVDGYSEKICVINNTNIEEVLSVQPTKKMLARYRYPKKAIPEVHIGIVSMEAIDASGGFLNYFS